MNVQRWYQWWIRIWLVSTLWTVEMLLWLCSNKTLTSNICMSIGQQTRLPTWKDLWLLFRFHIRKIETCFPPFSSHLVIEHLQLDVVLLQLRQLSQEPTAKVHVDEACRAELGHPRLLWAQAVESLRKISKERKENVSIIFIILCLQKVFYQWTSDWPDIHIMLKKDSKLPSTLWLWLGARHC